MNHVRASWSGGGGISVLVHGGAGSRDDEDDATDGCLLAAARAYAILGAGGSALDAVEAAVIALEDDPRYNAGLGAALTEDGEVELDAAIMDGRELRAGAVCGLRNHRNAIRVARAALDEGRHVFYGGEGARELGRRAHLDEVDPASLVTERARERLARALAQSAASDRGNTVGAVARDVHGAVAAATSTGGTTGKRRGRIGDSPVIGAGTHAENGRGAASMTGPGEAILRLTLAFRATLAMELGRSPERAAREALTELGARLGGIGGIILVDAAGRLGLARSTETMPWAARSEGGALDSGY
ncbi:MAG TPA: isoaspartyl peptidase/L-asparaginase [Polyangiaceae bacterium]|jgi:beta-aspartyl-peptidase (threonine type)|nr:isoaspartyl peptidase/L-asparaginase [Polyangiaceae bacterium]